MSIKFNGVFSLDRSLEVAENKLKTEEGINPSQDKKNALEGKLEPLKRNEERAKKVYPHKSNKINTLNHTGPKETYIIDQWLVSNKDEQGQKVMEYIKSEIMRTRCLETFYSFDDVFFSTYIYYEQNKIDNRENMRRLKTSENEKKSMYEELSDRFFFFMRAYEMLLEKDIETVGTEVYKKTINDPGHAMGKHTTRQLISVYEFMMNRDRTLDLNDRLISYLKSRAEAIIVKEFSDKLKKDNLILYSPVDDTLNTTIYYSGATEVGNGESLITLSKNNEGE